MIKFNENEFRDHLFDNYKDSIYNLIVGRKEPIVWGKNEFPPIHILLQQNIERKINEIVDSVSELVLLAKELRLHRESDSVSRVDIFGNSYTSGPTIIELKKSKQTERQAFTELLAYSNHFCTIFPGLAENSITSILIAPMKCRIVRDSLAQQLIINRKNFIALIPDENNGKIELRIYYPDVSYYQWVENKLLDDRSMLTTAISFSTIDGWIDTDIKSEDGKIPEYSKEALNTISNTISHKLESLGYNSLVYVAQMWGRVAQVFPYPNTLYVVTINPFASFRTSIYKNTVYGDSEYERIKNVRLIYDQLNEQDREDWLENMEGFFHDNLIEIVRKEFDNCFLNKEADEIQQEISTPNWYGVKTSMINAVTVHNLDIYLTGFLREIYLEYINYVYNTDECCIFYGDCLPKYSYKTFRKFLPIWEILSGLGFGNESTEN